MIKFFRKIRQNLLAEGKTSKYLKYAIGEIILVVIGILIAISIDNWNEGKKNKREELAILTNLKEEFAFNVEELKNIKQGQQMIQGACSQLLKHTGPNPQNYNPNTIDSLLGITTMSIRFNYKDGALQSLINSGKLGVIENKSLRNQIAQFTGIIHDATITQNTLREISWSKYIPFLEDNASLSNMMKTASFFKDKVSAESGFKVEYNMLLSNRKFENLLVSRLAITQVVLFEYNNLERHLQKIMEDISEELK